MLPHFLFKPSMLLWLQVIEPRHHEASTWSYCKTVTRGWEGDNAGCMGGYLFMGASIKYAKHRLPIYLSMCKKQKTQIQSQELKFSVKVLQRNTVYRFPLSMFLYNEPRINYRSSFYSSGLLKKWLPRVPHANALKICDIKHRIWKLGVCVTCCALQYDGVKAIIAQLHQVCRQLS